MGYLQQNPFLEKTARPITNAVVKLCRSRNIYPDVSASDLEGMHLTLKDVYLTWVSGYSLL